MVMDGSINVLVTLEFAFILALVFGLGLGLDLGLELGFALVHNISLYGAIQSICALCMDEGELYYQGIESYELEG